MVPTSGAAAKRVAKPTDGELPVAARARFDEHLAECADCRHYLDRYREAIRLGKAAASAADTRAVEEAPPELVLAVLAARKAHRPD